MYDPTVEVSIVNNNVFTAASTGLIVMIGWVITDWIVEPRLESVEVDGDPGQMPKLGRKPPLLPVLTSKPCQCSPV